MSPERLRQLLESVRAGDVDVEQALSAMRELPYRDVGVATIDHHRALRQGVPEVVFGMKKSAEQIVAISRELLDHGHNLLVTRLSPDKAAALTAAIPEVQHNALAQTARLELNRLPRRDCNPVAVVCAGTSDASVAEEAIETLDAVGLEFSRVYDVGVAGIHRLLGRAEELEDASAAIVIAGMEGALPSVVGGLVPYPVVSVPTSVGYGAALGGLTPLMAMLTSCSSGLTVVNIDNGFGAAMAVHRMLPRTPKAE